MLKDQLLTTYSKIQEERDKVKELLGNKNQNLKIWTFLSLSMLQKIEKPYSEEDTKAVVEQPFGGEISMSINWECNHLCQ